MRGPAFRGPVGGLESEARYLSIAIPALFTRVSRRL